MKRLLTILLITGLCLSGCAFGQGRFQDPVTFYYLRDHSDPDSQDAFFLDGAMGSEFREGAGHRNDLNYLLSIYLQGPLDDELRSPFPAGCHPMEIKRDGSTLHVALGSGILELSEIELTVACACLAKTCMELVPVDAVHIEGISPDGTQSVSRIYTHEMLILEENYTQTPEATNETQ